MDSTNGWTRRGYLKRGGALLGGGVLAGCAGNESGGTKTSTPETSGSQTTGTKGGSMTDKSTTEGTKSEGSNSVMMSPMGAVEFDGVPQKAFVVFPQYADMAVALGHGDAVNALYVPEMSGKTMNTYYDRLDGVSFEWKGLPDPLKNGLNKESLFSLDSDVHFVDPAYVSTQKNWDQNDIREVRDKVAPWFGNFYSGTRHQPPKGYRDDYQYYDLWQLFEKVAQVFQEEDRYEALESIHDDLLSTIEKGLPPKEERPTAVRVTLGDDSFYTYHLNKPGYWLADTRPLKATDAFADRDWPNLWGTVDYEAMLDADPDVILMLWGVSPGYYVGDARKKMKNDRLGKRLSAVQNDHVYASGMRYQGPIMNLFQLEMTAKELYPDQFGEWPGYVNGNPYPEIPDDERLFDRTRLANVVNGNF